MISVETFVEFVKKRDLGRMKFAIRDAHFDLDSTDEVSLHPHTCNTSSSFAYSYFGVYSSTYEDSSYTLTL